MADDLLTLRPEVAAFAQEMERRLRAHDAERGSGAWRQHTYDSLMEHLCKEVGELEAAHLLEEIVDEAADVANQAMMVADRTGRLKTDQQTAPLSQPTEPAQPAPDEATVASVSSLLWDAYDGEIARQMRMTPHPGSFALMGEVGRNAQLAVGRAALAWADHCYGGEVAALRGAMQRVIASAHLADAKQAADAALVLTSSAPAPDASTVDGLCEVYDHAYLERIDHESPEWCAKHAMEAVLRAVGGRAVALEAALTPIVAEVRRPVHNGSKFSEFFAAIGRIHADLLPRAEAALALTPGPAEAAVRRVLDRSARLAALTDHRMGLWCAVTPCESCSLDTGGRGPSREGCRWCVADELREALAPFLAARGGGGNG